MRKLCKPTQLADGLDLQTFAFLRRQVTFLCLLGSQDSSIDGQLLIAEFVQSWGQRR
jgi:hypothetical protein